jgi:hypothetical protein
MPWASQSKRSAQQRRGIKGGLRGFDVKKRKSPERPQENP